MRRIALLAAAVGLLIPILASGPAHAQATRTWVSGVGDDANPCSRTAPCKTFAGAISKTATGGEINCLDSAGFGAVTITKAITILCEGVVGGVLAAGTNGIVVSAAGPAKVTLSGLDIEGFGTGLSGVRITGGAKVFINKTTIRNFTASGVNVVGAAGARALIQDSEITGCATGLTVAGAGGAANTGILIRTTLDNNTTSSTSVTAPSVLFLNGASLFGSAAAIVNNGGATVTSFSNNIITGTGLPTVTIALK